MEYEFRRYCPEFKGQIAALRAGAFGGDQAFNIEYFEWKYEQNPYLAKPHFYIALFDGKVVAIRGYYGSRWQAGQSSYSWIIPTSCELAVEPDHRRRGLAYRIHVYAAEDVAARGYQCLMNLSANPASRRLQTRSHFQRVAIYKDYQKGAPSQIGVSNSLPPQSEHAIFQEFDLWAQQTSGPIYGASEPRYVEMSELVSRYEEDSRIHLVRDEAFYRWRLDNPACHYRFLYHQDGDALQGFIILHRNEFGGCTTVIDWATSAPSVLSKLLAAALESNIDWLKITSTYFSKEEIQLLQSLSFDPVTVPDKGSNMAPGMLLHVAPGQQPEQPVFSDLEMLEAISWNIRMIASDAF